MPPNPIAPVEIGALTASTPQQTEFIGSASGVFFLNTVFRAFARSASNSKTLSTEPSSSEHSRPENPGLVDSRLVDPDAPTHLDQETIGLTICLDHEGTRAPGPGSYGVNGHGLGAAPDQSSARALLMLYLRNWHPLFPFLHGPTLLETIQGLYEDGGQAPGRLSLSTRLCHAIICQCVFNIAALDWNDGPLPPNCQVESPTRLLSLSGYIARNHDTLSLQALLAAQLYLVSVMSLRAASTIGGTLSRLMFHAGFHRCPFRYAQISPPEGDLRKRIFWSAYVLDRYLSQALGHPLGIQDSDLDVCIPGMDELHKPANPRQQTTPTASQPGNGVLAHLPKPRFDQNLASEERPSSEQSGDLHSTSNEDASAGLNAGRSPGDVSVGSQILGYYVLYCRLTGQALERFHISLQNRTINAENTMELQSNVHAWWNNLPQELQDEYTGGKMELTSTFTFFFSILYNHLLLLINRPFLSLSPTSLEFKASLQTCVAASRQIITTSKHQSEWNLIVSWPGRLSAAWMAGLVLSFACTLRLYPFNKAQKEVEDSIRELLVMDRSWNNARHCVEALRSLQGNLRIQYAEREKGLTSPPSSSRPAPDGNLCATSGSEPAPNGDSRGGRTEPSRKRKRSDRYEGPANVDGNEQLSQLRQTGLTLDQTLDTESHQLPNFDNAAMPSALYTPGQGFGFSSGQFATLDDLDILGLGLADDMYVHYPGTFGNIGWEAMANGSGNMQDWVTWDTTRPEAEMGDAV